MWKVDHHFSHNSENYRKFRPSYPAELYLEKLQFVKTNDRCRDCGTGKRQAGVELAKYFTTVFATDIGRSQLNSAENQKNIVTKKRGQQTGFKNDQFDFIAVAQAIHGFDLE